MEVPPAAISTDSKWYSEYIKHTDNPEIQQLEKQLVGSSAKQHTNQEPTKHDDDPKTANSGSAAMSPGKKHQLLANVSVKNGMGI